MNQSLSEFATAQRRCFVCRIPERDELEAGRSEGVSLQTMGDWLRSLGYELPHDAEGRLRGHWRRGHHLREKDGQ